MISANKVVSEIMFLIFHTDAFSFGSNPNILIKQGNKIILEINAKSIATTKACPNNLSGKSELRLSTANPPAVVSAAAIIALPVVALVKETQFTIPALGLCSISSSSLVTK